MDCLHHYIIIMLYSFSIENKPLHVAVQITKILTSTKCFIS